MSTELKTTIERLKMLRTNAEERISKIQQKREESLPQMEDILYRAGLLAWKEEAEIFSDSITLLESTGKDTEMLKFCEDHYFNMVCRDGRWACSPKHPDDIPESHWRDTPREAITAAMQKESEVTK